MNPQDLPMQLFLFVGTMLFIFWVFNDKTKPPKLNP